MADFLDLDIQTGANVSITVPRINVRVRVVQSDNQGQTILDQSAGFEVWQTLRDLTAAQKRAVMRPLIERLIRVRAGLDDGLSE